MGMIINLRKQRNKARLMPAKSQVLGRPEKTKSVKNQANSEPEQEPTPKRVKNEEFEETQIRQKKEKIIVMSTNTEPVPTPEPESEETDTPEENLEPEPEPNKIGQELEDNETRWAKPIDGNKVLKEHRIRKEKEQEEINRIERLEQARNKGIKSRLRVFMKE